MPMFFRSMATAACIATAVQCFTIGVLAPKLPREVCRPEVQQVTSLTFPAVKLVHINNADGAVSVATHRLNEIRLTADIRAYTGRSRDDIAEYLETLLRTDSIGDTLSILTEPKNRPDGLDLRVDYSLLVPEDTDLGVVCMDGNVTVGPGCGRVSIKGNYTDILIQAPRDAVRAKTMTGRIRVVDAPEATLLETVNGSIYADMVGGTLEASTTTGSIYTTLAAPEVMSCDLTVLMGDITLTMSEACSAEIDASTGRGAISSDFPIDDWDGVQRKRSLHGTIDAGHTRLSMNSLNGNIRLTRSTT